MFEFHLFLLHWNGSSIIKDDLQFWKILFFFSFLLSLDLSFFSELNLLLLLISKDFLSQNIDFSPIAIDQVHFLFNNVFNSFDLSIFSGHFLLGLENFKLSYFFILFPCNLKCIAVLHVKWPLMMPIHHTFIIKSLNLYLFIRIKHCEWNFYKFFNLNSGLLAKLLSIIDIPVILFSALLHFFLFLLDLVNLFNWLEDHLLGIISDLFGISFLYFCCFNNIFSFLKVWNKLCLNERLGMLLKLLDSNH